MCSSDDEDDEEEEVCQKEREEEKCAAVSSDAWSLDDVSRRTSDIYLYYGLSVILKL